MSQNGRFVGLLISLLWAGTALAGPVWDSVGPEGTDIRDLAVDPNQPQRIYAASRNVGVFVSEDAGLTWTLRRNGLPTEATTGGVQPFHGMACDPVDGRVFALGAEDIYVSGDQGGVWSKMTRPGGAVGIFSGLFFDPDDHESFVVQNRGGVFVYDFAGADTVRSWSKASGIASTPIYALEVSPVDPDRYYAAAGQGPTLYLSTDRARTWTPVATMPGGGLRDLYLSPVNSAWVWAATGSGVYRSPDGGATWELRAPASAQIYHLRTGGDAALVAVGGGIEGFGRGGIYADNATTTDLVFVRPFFHTRVSASVDLPGGHQLISSDMGVFETSAEGMLEPRVTGMEGSDITVIAPARGSPVVYAGAGITYDAGIFRSPDGGTTWEQRSLGLTNPDIRSIAVYAQNPDIVYLGTADATDDTGENGGVFKTIDGGLHWTDLTGGIPHVGPRIIIAIVIHPTNPDIVYASVQAYEGGIYKTTDGGVTWTRRATGLESMPDGLPGYEVENPFKNYYAMLSLALRADDPNTLYIGAGGCWGGTYHTNDGALTWTRRSEGGAMEVDAEVASDPSMFPVHLELFNIVIDPANPARIYAAGARAELFGSEQFGILFRSVDSGETWSLIRQGARSDYLASPATGLALPVGRPGHLTVASRAGVFLSEDDGDTWTTINEGLPARHWSTRAIAVDPDEPDRLFLSTALGGVYRRDLAPTAVTLLGLSAQGTPEGTVVVRWTVASAVDHLGFHVDRETPSGDRVRLTATLLRGQESYAFTDPAPPAGGARYWIVEVDRFGGETAYGPITATPAVFTARLSAAYPNPMAGSTSLRMAVPRGGRARVAVYDLGGRVVATLLDALIEPGERELVWDGTDDRGARVGRGIYFIKAEFGGRVTARKVVLTP